MYWDMLCHISISISLCEFETMYTREHTSPVSNWNWQLEIGNNLTLATLITEPTTNSDWLAFGGYEDWFYLDGGGWCFRFGSNLVERLTLLVIITFGETIVGIASWFTLETLNLWSVLVFVIVVAMFGCYVIAFNKLIDEENDADTGVGLIYTHYPILLGVSFVTVSLSFLAEEEIRLSFSTLLLFVGMALFYTGILLNGKRNKNRYRYPKSFWLILTAALLLGLAAGLLVGSAEAVILAGATVTSVLAMGNLHFYHKGIKINHGGN